MKMQGVSGGYLLSNPGVTQRCADQVVVVREIEAQRPKFLPVIGLGQQPREDYYCQSRRPDCQAIDEPYASPLR